MIPFLVFRKSYSVNKAPYKLFLEITQQAETGSFTDIDTRFESNDPPVFRLEIKKNQLGIQPRSNAILWVKIEEEGNKSLVDIGLYSSITIYIWVALLAITNSVMIVRLIIQGDKISSIVLPLMLLFVFAMLDLYIRKQLLTKFEDFIRSY